MLQNDREPTKLSHFLKPERTMMMIDKSLDRKTIKSEQIAPLGKVSIPQYSTDDQDACYLAPQKSILRPRKRGKKMVLLLTIHESISSPRLLETLL